MKLPSKTTPYKRSVLSLFPGILSALKKQDMRVADLQKEFSDVPFGDFISALDCLYALRAIELDEERGLISCVGTDSM